MKSVHVSGYVLEYEKKNLPATREVVDLPATVTSYTVRDLVPVTNYTIYVSAKTKIGAGQVASADIQSGVPPGRNCSSADLLVLPYHPSQETLPSMTASVLKQEPNTYYFMTGHENNIAQPKVNKCPSSTSHFSLFDCCFSVVL